MKKALGGGGRGTFTLWQGLSVPAALKTSLGRTDVVSGVAFR